MRYSIYVGCIFAIATAGLLVVAAGGCGKTSQTEAVASSLQSLSNNPPSASSKENATGGSGKGMAAIKHAAEAGKYLFIFFLRAEDDQTLAMRQVFEKAAEQALDRAQSTVVNITDASEKAIIDKFDLSRAPMPLVLVLAPNGAITGGFPNKFEEEQLLSSFATPCTEKVMKHLQAGKLVFLCIQNDKTQSNDAAMRGVRDFQADARFASATEIVMLNPADTAEAALLSDLKIDPKSEEAVTAFLAPPGATIAEYKGATDKEELAAALQKASSACCPGGACGPGGCAPQP